MDFTTILIIAFALAVDAFAVAIAAGVSICQATLRQTFRLAWHFGLFQGGMNVLGWAVGLSFRNIIEHFDHWLAFGLLALVGARMIIEAARKGQEKQEAKDPTRGRTLVILAVATSIDSLAVGLSFSVLNTSILLPALTIGIVTTFLTAFGLHLGCLVGSASKLGPRAEIAGGLVLIAIGVKILAEHGVL